MKKPIKKNTFTGVWQDKELEFDLNTKYLELRPGEEKIDSINSVEDTKGNNGIRGKLTVTNLRLIWESHRNKKINLSIGHNCVQKYEIKSAQSKLRGATQALFTSVKHRGSRYEFIFTSLVRRSPRLFATAQAVYRAYDTTRLYRDLKLRGAIIRDDALVVLPNEEISHKIGGIWNLSQEQGNLGTFYITNFRVVWFAKLAPNFNVSIPYIQMKSIETLQSKYGKALVIKTEPGYALGFSIKPEEKLSDLKDLLFNLQNLHTKNPSFGLNFTIENKPEDLDAVTMPKSKDDVKIVPTEDYMGNFLSRKTEVRSYLVDNSRNETVSAQFDKHLGLAVEVLPQGTTIQDIWRL